MTSGTATTYRINGNGPTELLAEFGSPLHVIDEDALRRDVASFLETFRSVHSPVEFYYSYKTNPVPAALKILHESGVGAEVISPFEYWLARQMGVPGREIVVNGVGKTLEYVEAVVAGGCRIFNIDHPDELELLKRAGGRSGKQIGVGIRIVGPSGWKAQFGIEPEDVLELADSVARSEVAYLAGLHVHLSTNTQLPRVYERALSVLAELCARLRERGHPLDLIDVGGGYPVPGVAPLGFREEASLSLLNRMPPASLRRRARSVREHAAVIGRGMGDVALALGGESPTLLMEPGRALSSSSQTLLFRVNSVKLRADGTRYAITDAGPHGVAHPMLFEEHRIALVGRDSSEQPVPHTIVGPTCSPPDILGRGVTLPALRAGDILAVEDSGAYFTSLEANFGFTKPAIVLVGPSGAPKLVRARESYEDVVRRDLS